MGQRAVITIDGPAGSGKSTVGRLLAQRLGYQYLDSGALYRLVAWQAYREGLDPADQTALKALLASLAPQLVADSQSFRIRLEGRELAGELRTPEISRVASQVAKVPEVRQWVTERLRKLAKNGGVVAEGRDLGSVVFPQAQVKFYLDASLTVRAERRRREWRDQGAETDLQATLTSLAERDRQDQNRQEAPLIMPAGAYYIDTSHLTPAEVVAYCLKVIAHNTSRKKQKEKYCQ